MRKISRQRVHNPWAATDLHAWYSGDEEGLRGGWKSNVGPFSLDEMV